MGGVLTRRPDREAVTWRVWLGPVLTGLPASLMIALLSLPAPRAGEVTGVIIPAGAGVSGLLALTRVDSDLRVVDQRWNGRLIFAVFERRDFVQLARRNGALVLFDAKSIGCRFAPGVTAGPHKPLPSTRAIRWAIASGRP